MRECGLVVLACVAIVGCAVPERKMPAPERAPDRSAAKPAAAAPVDDPAPEPVRAEPGTVVVAPDGNDAWSGLLVRPDPKATDGPVATLGRALAITRELRARHERPRILVMPGEYYLDEALVIGPEDGGLAIEGAPGGKAILYGARRVTGWRADGENLFAASLDGVKEGKWDFRALLVDGELAPRARLPEEGTFEHRSEFKVRRKVGFCCWHRDPTEKELTTLIYDPKDLGPWLDANNAELTIYHMWTDSYVGVAHNDTETHTLTFRQRASDPPGSFRNHKYIVWNVREGMTRPGQWCLDRTAGKLVYRPRPGEDVNELEILAPTTEVVIWIRGKKKEYVQDVTLRNLVVSATTTPLTSPGFGAGKYKGGVSAVFAKRCVLDRLEVRHVGGTGIKTVRAANVRISNCHVHHTGGAGIHFGGAETLVEDNLVQHVGLLFPSGIGIYGGGPRCVVAHNDVQDVSYSGINVSGKHTAGTRIENNLVTRAMKVLHDGGGIYSSYSRSLTIRGNVVRDVATQPGGYAAWGIYIDQYCEDPRVENNLVIGSDALMHNHISKRGVISNNVFVTSGNVKLSFRKSTDFTFERNVVVAGGRMNILEPSGASTFRNNALGLGDTRVIGSDPNKPWKQRHAPVPMENGNTIADPGLVEYESGRVRFAEGSRALALGVRPFDNSRAGRRTGGAAGADREVE